MPYIVITGTDRKEFDYLKDALEYKTGQSRIYEMDGFGNLRPISQQDYAGILEHEPALDNKKAIQESQGSAEPKEQENESQVQEIKTQASIEKEDAVQETPSSFKRLDQIPDMKKKELVEFDGEGEKKEKDPYAIVKLIVLVVFAVIALFIVFSVIRPFLVEAQSLT